MYKFGLRRRIAPVAMYMNKSTTLINNKGKIFFGWVILAVCSLATVIAWGVYYSFGVWFQELQSAFQTNRADISLISSISIFTIYIMGFLYGWAVDKYGPRIPVSIGGVFIWIGLLLSSRATAIWQLYISMGFLVGFGISATVVPFISTLTRWFVKMRGLVVGIVSAAAGLGMMVMAPLSQWLLTKYGWRVSFIILGIANLVILCIAAFLIRGYPKEKGLIPYGATESGDEENAAPKQTVATAILDSSNDSSLKAALKGKDLWLVLGIRTLLALIIFTVSTHLVNYAKDAGMSPTNAAVLMTIIGAVSIFGKIGSGYLADKIGSKKIIITCAVMLVALMIWLSTHLSTWMLPVFAVVYGLAYGGCFPTINTIVAEAFGVADVAKILGFVNIGTAAGSFAGPWLAGYIFDTTSSYSVAFLAAAAVGLIAVLLAIPFGKHTKQLISGKSQ